ncbi:NAD(P)/FAD-dependent oxidoreductase, partial [Aquisalimonas sp.]|uniref:NAD(P)/FAD-dependent oxidoreductase n=1 Tax=Aquisalimonas sp. TaxID=1872621 RepID=UPI0025BCB5EC
MSKTDSPHRILVVGGGAGGLELVTHLGRKLGKRRDAEIMLVDAELAHIWKPLFHEIAAGTLYSYEDTLDYLAQAKRHHFRFQYGRMAGLDRSKQHIRLAAEFDESGAELAPERCLAYDTLVIAVGSVSNHFDTPGAAEHCMYLDSAAEAERFQRMMARAYFRAQVQRQPLAEGQLSIVIVGAGATGVELAGELRDAARKAVHYGLDRIDPDTDLKLTLVEGADRVLPALSPRLSERTYQQLQALGIRVITGNRVVAVTREGVELSGGDFIPAELKVWSAGIQAPDWLRELDGLTTNWANQLEVGRSLQTTEDPNIFAFGDCAACPLPDGEGLVPPRAQAASQQAAFLGKALQHHLRGQSPGTFTYKDRGSLITLSENRAVGRLTGGVFGNLAIEGKVARYAYSALYRKHLTAVHGMPRVLLMTLAQALTRPTRTRL